jgi:hypothetical protein
MTEKTIQETRICVKHDANWLLTVSNEWMDMVRCAGQAERTTNHATPFFIRAPIAFLGDV